jgi:predicted O-methyltransferase YrrM
MAGKGISMTDELYAFVLANNPESEAARGLRETTDALPNSGMMTAPEQSRFLAWLAGTIQAKRVVEIGVFTGYTTLLLAEHLAEDARITACDVSEEFTSIGRPFWSQAGVEQKIVLRLAPALDTLGSLEGPIDFAYIDADKPNYPHYYRAVMDILRPGGIVALDNILWSGEITQPAGDDPNLAALQQVAEDVKSDPRVEALLLPIADGLLLARKK